MFFLVNWLLFLICKGKVGKKHNFFHIRNHFQQFIKKNENPMKSYILVFKKFKIFHNLQVILITNLMNYNLQNINQLNNK